MWHTNTTTYQTFGRSQNRLQIWFSLSRTNIWIDSIKSVVCLRDTKNKNISGVWSKLKPTTDLILSIQNVNLDRQHQICSLFVRHTNKNIAGCWSKTKPTTDLILSIQNENLDRQHQICSLFARHKKTKKHIRRLVETKTDYRFDFLYPERKSGWSASNL